MFYNLNRYYNYNLYKILINTPSSHKFFNISKNYSSKINYPVPAMRFIQFIRKCTPTLQLGVLSEDGKSFIQLSNNGSNSNNDMINFIKKFKTINDIENKLANLTSEEISNDIQILPPVNNPEKIICIGLNYLDHCLEQNKEKPKEPMFFSKYASTLVGPTGNVISHPITNKLDWEVELAVIIGKEAKNISKNEALDYVFGYSVAQDISARDWQKERNGGQFLIGKSMDTFCPLGPSIVHKSIINDPYNLSISCKVNGIIKQNGNTKDMLYRIEDIIYHLTQCITLQPGDVILTGTPAGVGMHRNPPEYLKVGDVIESEIECLGKIVNKIVEK